ncbi:hypothetical protein [uncultured Psychrobacter sp.]|jgi:hypothetical protein|nr:hypothetical protein [uncultured Psychrobacter sp.]
MEKQLQNIVGLNTALVVLGWLAFFSSFLFPEALLITIILQTAARVLP